MKKLTKLLLVLLCIVIALSTAACGDPSGGPSNDPNPSNPSDWTPTGAEVTVADGSNASNTVIYHASGLSFKADTLSSLLSSAGISGIETSASASVNAKYRIVIGATELKASELAKALYDSAFASAKDDFHWAFAYHDGDLAIYADSDIGYEKAFAALISDYVNAGKLVVRDNISVSGVYTLAEYEAYLDAVASEQEAAKKAENALLLDGIIAKVESQREDLKTHEGKISPYESGDSIIKLFQVYTADIGVSSAGAPSVTPKDEHPRLLVNDTMYYEIKKSIREDSDMADEFKRLLDLVLPNEGILGEPKNHGYNTTVSSSNIHNLEYEYLEAIQAKALGHLIYDDDYYGYQAIYYMKNFLKSLDIVQMANDQCRDYGYVMYTAAIVYDWCYDLLTEEDKVQFIAGVENCICKGKNQKTAKMEVGFPPKDQGAVADHGCEYQILRDYLSFAVAIYGDNSSWWTYIAGRVYNEFVPMRNFYFKSGIAPQGTGVYLATRHLCDIYSAWILKIATGENPYQNMDKTLRSILSYECAPGRLFNDGDGDQDYVNATKYTDMAFMSAYLFGDETVLAQAYALLGDSIISFKTHDKGYMGISNPVFMALTGLCDIKPAEDRYADMDLITYNGSPLGQYIIHSEWNNADAVAVFMRIKEYNTGNHEHYDSGTFEIYYKGALSNDGGVYNNYSSQHNSLFHQDTISHNGLIIYDPAKSQTNGGWYSGGQRNRWGNSPGPNLESWIGDTRWTFGKVTGHQHGYADEEGTEPLYAYIAGDISAAYDPTTATYVGRRMLTVLTGDETLPMVFFVYDDITSKATAEKRFLLQISSKEAPDITSTDRKDTVVTENGNGRLVLTCLSDPTKIQINGVGGRNEGKYDANLSKNYQINGKQLVPQDPTRDDGHWGRVEVVYKGTSSNVTFMNVMYVTDKGSKEKVSVVSVTNAVGLEGGIFNDSVVGLFATSRTPATETISCTTSSEEDTMSYYVSGVAEGSWTVTVDGKSCGTYTATEEGGLLTFTAPAGAVVISPAK